MYEEGAVAEAIRIVQFEYSKISIFCGSECLDTGKPNKVSAILNGENYGLQPSSRNYM